MENSKAYNYITKQMSATGREKLDGYDERAFDDLTDNEKNKIEDKIWRRYTLGLDDGLAVYLPKLRKHDGISALKKSLQKEIMKKKCFWQIFYIAQRWTSHYSRFSGTVATMKMEDCV